MLHVHIADFSTQPDPARQRVEVSNLSTQVGQQEHDGPCDSRNVATRSSNHPPLGGMRGAAQGHLQIEELDD